MMSQMLLFSRLLRLLLLLLLLLLLTRMTIKLLSLLGVKFRKCEHTTLTSSSLVINRPRLSYNMNLKTNLAASQLYESFTHWQFWKYRSFLTFLVASAIKSTQTSPRRLQLLSIILKRLNQTTLVTTDDLIWLVLTNLINICIMSALSSIVSMV